MFILTPLTKRPTLSCFEQFSDMCFNIDFRICWVSVIILVFIMSQLVVGGRGRWWLYTRSFKYPQEKNFTDLSPGSEVAAILCNFRELFWPWQRAVFDTQNSFCVYSIGLISMSESNDYFYKFFNFLINECICNG